MALTPMLIKECYMRALEEFHERHIVVDAEDDQDAIDKMRGPLVTHLELYMCEPSLQEPHSSHPSHPSHPALSKAIGQIIQGFSHLDSNSRMKASQCFHHAQDEAQKCFPDLHVYEHQCLATRIRILSAIIRCYLLHQEVDDSFDSCSSAIHDFIHCPHVVTSIRDACEGKAVFGVYDVAHRLPVVRDLHSMTHQVWMEFGRSVPIVCHGILMDLKGAKDKLHFKGHDDWVRTLATDDWVLYSGSSDGTIRVWDLETMEATGVLTGHHASVEDLVLSPDGSLLFSASVDHTIRVWDTDSLSQIAVLEGHQRDVHAVKIYIPNKSLLVGKLVEEKEEQPLNMVILSGSMDGNIIFWSMETFEQEGIIKLEKDSIGILCLESNFSDLFAGCTDNSIRQFDIDGKQQIRVLRSHHDWVRCMAVFDNKLFTACDGGELRVWDLHGRLNMMGETDVADRTYGMRVIENAIYLPCGSQGAFKLDPKTLKVKSISHNHHQHHGPMYCLTNSTKRGTMYGGFEDGSILEFLLTDH